MKAAGWARLAVAATAAATLAMVSTPALAATQASHKNAKPPKLALLGHGTFWECPAKTTALLVGVNQLVFHPGQMLKVEFLAKNVGAAACNYVAPYASVAPGPTASVLSVGPCGSMGMEIMGKHKRNVWPGVQPFNCPALGFAQLQPGGSVLGAGTWGQTLPSGTKRVPAGSYTLVVDGQFKFAIQVKAH